MKGLAQGGDQFLRTFDQIVMFGAGAGDSNDIDLLKGIVANELGRHLAG